MSARTAQKSRVRVKPFDRSNSTFPVHVALLLPAVGEEIGATKLVDRPNPVGKVSSEGRNEQKRKREKEKKRLTNGTIDAIKSTIVSSPFGLITSSSLNALPIVKLRNRSNSMLGLSASYPCIHQPIIVFQSNGIERKELSESWGA